MHYPILVTRESGCMSHVVIKFVHPFWSSSYREYCYIKNRLVYPTTCVRFLLQSKQTTQLNLIFFLINHKTRCTPTLAAFKEFAAIMLQVGSFRLIWCMYSRHYNS